MDIASYTEKILEETKSMLESIPNDTAKNQGSPFGREIFKDILGSIAELMVDEHLNEHLNATDASDNEPMTKRKKLDKNANHVQLKAPITRSTSKKSK